MPSINRATLPQNFLDETSRGLRLKQPEPQYFFARMAMAHQLAAAAIDAGAPTIQQFVSMAGGGATVPPFLDQLIRVAEQMPGAIQVVEEFGKNAGDTVKFHRPIYEGGGYDELSREVKPDKATSTTGQAIKAEEVPIVLKEYEGPYNTVGSEVRPYAIRDFDAKYRANRDQLASLTSLHLRRDYVKWMDTVLRDKFRAASNITFPSGIANAAAFVSGGTAIVSLEQIANARKSLSDREWPPFSNGRYVCLVPTKFNVDMLGDVDYREMSKLHMQGRNLLFGYISSYQDVDIYEVTTLKQYVAGESIAGSTVASGVTLQEALLFGPDGVGFGAPKGDGALGVFWADDTNYGKEAKVIWRANHAFQTIDERAIQRIVFQ